MCFSATAIYTAWFFSVWCFLAAVSSAIVLLHFLQKPSTPDTSTLAATAVEIQVCAT
jgi:hypothetical protein